MKDQILLKKTARHAGILYLLFGITGMFGLMYVPSQILVHGDAAKTAENIIHSELLFRWGWIGYLTSQILFVFLVLKLHQLLKSVNDYQNRLMVNLVIISIPIAFINILNQIAALVLLSNTELLTAFDQNQLNLLAEFFLDLYEYGIVVVEIFWGLWLFPFGLLVYQSSYIPKIFGLLLIIACIGYLANSFAGLVYPTARGTVAIVTSITGTIGEFAIIFWLLIKGVRIPQITGENLNS